MRLPKALVLVTFFTLAHFASGASYPCSSPSYVDSFANLPPAPVFTTSALSSGLTPTPSTQFPIIQDHYSETAKISQYRPPAFTPTANPAQSNCPHMGNNLKNWHDPATWTNAGNTVPTSGDVTLPAGTNVLISSCSINPSTVFGTITIPADSSLIFADAPISINAAGFNVMGSLQAGSLTCRLRNKLTITLYGSRGAQALPASGWVKGIYVTGSIDLHGVQYYPTWTRLARTASPGDTWIFIQDKVNWQVNQSIVITTSELKDARDWHRNEERTIVDVRTTTLGANVFAIQLNSPLSYQHYAGNEYQSEVALESRNILVQGDPFNSEPTDTANATCTYGSEGSTYPCNNKYLTGFGGHIQVAFSSAQGRFSGIELYRVGQTNQLARYPLHFHMMGTVGANAAIAQDCSVHRSYFRCYAIHGTQGATVTQNTAYDVTGHCYFLEDGVESNNVISYNQAALIHPLGPYQNPAYGLNGDSWWGQTLGWYDEDDSTLLLPSDMSASCFYITNAYNDIIGNAASGGWTGFAMPALPATVKMSVDITNLCPKNLPFKSPFRGNTAHSTGFWWGSAGAIYVGGLLKHKSAGGPLTYNAGRMVGLTRDTCNDSTIGSPANPGSCPQTGWLWMRFEDNKVWLANRGMQNWGDRSEIIRLEIHDVGLAMNVFGQVWIDQMLMECRSNNLPTWMSGCPTAGNMTNTPRWGICNVRDYTFWKGFMGFQWYDVGQSHLLTNSVFRNCHNAWAHCIYGSTTAICDDTGVFQMLTHSDEFVPEMMQATKALTFQNCNNYWRFTTDLSDPGGVTVSGRLQNWFDSDGTAARLPGSPVMLGSNRSMEWWKYNPSCTLYNEMWVCPLQPGDSAASIYLEHDPLGTEQNIGDTICINGNSKLPAVPCPVIGTVTHFGRSESTALQLAENAKVTGPIINSAGGWFIRFASGTPKVLSIRQTQILPADILLLAIPYPSGTTFSINATGASWCGPTWAVCSHPFTQVSSVSAVVNGWGDVYYFSNNVLYLRVVTGPSTFGSPGKDAPWNHTWTPSDVFSRGGLSLQPAQYGSATNWQYKVTITANCASNPCAAQPSVQVPPAFTLKTTTGATSTTAASATSTTASATSTTASATVSGASTSSVSTASASTSSKSTSATASSTSASGPSTSSGQSTSSAGGPASSTTDAGSSTTTTDPAVGSANSVQAVLATMLFACIVTILL